MDSVSERVSGHYGWSGLMEAIDSEIRRVGIEPAEVTVDELAPVDNYHWHRLAGTLALAHAAAVRAEDRVLDVGGGIGGPARQLARRFGCEVTVLDLTQDYCDVGRRLTEWTKLEPLVSFVCADALAMPFADETFDLVWTQHASMNIPDKAGLYREIARVLRPGGRFAFFDVLAGPNQPIHFPVPWAAEPSFSFLVSPEQTQTLIGDAGLREIRWVIGDELDDEIARADQELEETSPHPSMSPGILNGRNAAEMGANVGRNRAEGRIVAVIGIYERPA